MNAVKANAGFTPIHTFVIGISFLEKVMNSVKKIAMFMCVALPVFAHAGESAVKWHDFNDYRDVRSSNQAKGSYHKHIIKSFEELQIDYKAIKQACTSKKRILSWESQEEILIDAVIG